LAAVKLNNKWGYIDIMNNVLIPINFDQAYMFNNGLAKVNVNGHEFEIDKNGVYRSKIKQTSSNIDFDAYREKLKSRDLNNLSRFMSFNLFEKIFSGKWYFVDKTGKVVLSYNYDYVADSYNGLRLVELNGKYGFIKDEK
jgi:hypothetical protein